MRKLKNYKPTKFKAKGSYYDKEYADFAVAFIESLCHTKGTWAGKKFELIDWQEPRLSVTCSAHSSQTAIDNLTLPTLKFLKSRASRSLPPLLPFC